MSEDLGQKISLGYELWIWHLTLILNSQKFNSVKIQIITNLFKNLTSFPISSQSWNFSSFYTSRWISFYVSRNFRSFTEKKSFCSIFWKIINLPPRLPKLKLSTDSGELFMLQLWFQKQTVLWWVQSIDTIFNFFLFHMCFFVRLLNVHKQLLLAFLFPPKDSSHFWLLLVLLFLINSYEKSFHKFLCTNIFFQQNCGSSFRTITRRSHAKCPRDFTANLRHKIQFIRMRQGREICVRLIQWWEKTWTSLLTLKQQQLDQQSLRYCSRVKKSSRKSK